MTTCPLTLTGTQTNTSSSCPNTIEFVQIAYKVKSGTNVSNVSFTMNLDGQIGKEIVLITPTTCKATTCTVSGDVAFKGGTVGFMGDSFTNMSQFNFSFNASEIEISQVTVFGH